MTIYVQADLDAIDRAIASGTLAVRFADGRQVTYRALADLMRARAHVAAELAAAAGRRISAVYAGGQKGL